MAPGMEPWRCQKKSPRAPGRVTNGVEEEEKAREPEMAPRMRDGVDDAAEKGWRRKKPRNVTNGAGRRHQWRREDDEEMVEERRKEKAE